jgi:serine protease AprX
MAAGVTSGTVALLLEQKPNLSPAEVKLALQATSSLVSGEGLLTSGAGSVNAVAATRFASNPRQGFGATEISGESVATSGLAFVRSSSGQPDGVRGNTNASARSAASSTIVWGGAALKGNTIVWGTADTIIWGSTIVWGSASDTIIWGSTADTIVWGSTIIWGSAADTIIWGSADTIIWGSTIVWGSAADTIIWGSHVDSNTIIWGSAVEGNTIIWGSAADTIIWGSVADTIIWGSADTIIWGSAADTIVWGS